MILRVVEIPCGNGDWICFFCGGLWNLRFGGFIRRRIVHFNAPLHSRRESHGANSSALNHHKV